MYSWGAHLEQPKGKNFNNKREKEEEEEDAQKQNSLKLKSHIFIYSAHTQTFILTIHNFIKQKELIKKNIFLFILIQIFLKEFFGYL